MKESEWLNELKVDDIVIIKRRGGVSIKKVTRTTKTLIIIKNEKFRRSNGSLLSNGKFDICTLQMPTKERIKEVKEYILRSRVKSTFKNLNFSSLDISIIHKLNKIIDDIEKKNESKRIHS